jgi:hypothetical protein
MDGYGFGANRSCSILKLYINVTDSIIVNIAIAHSNSFGLNFDLFIWLKFLKRFQISHVITVLAQVSDQGWHVTLVLAEGVETSTAVNRTQIELQDSAHPTPRHPAVLQRHVPAEGGGHESKLHGRPRPAFVWIEPFASQLQAAKAPVRLAPSRDFRFSRQFEDRTHQSVKGGGV